MTNTDIIVWYIIQKNILFHILLNKCIQMWFTDIDITNKYTLCQEVGESYFKK